MVQVPGGAGGVQEEGGEPHQDKTCGVWSTWHHRRDGKTYSKCIVYVKPYSYLLPYFVVKR